MTDTKPLLVENGPAPAGTADVTAPWDLSVIGKVETGGPDHVEAALATAEAAFLDRDGWLSLPERIAILERTAVLMTAEAEELAVASAREGGKPLPDSQVEVARAIDGCKRAVEVLRTEQGGVVPMGGTASSVHRLAVTRREPIGVVVAVSAFNHPLNLIVHQVVPAVAVGAPVVVKPADDVPLIAIRFVELLREAGLPPQWCQVLVTDELATAEKLVTDPRVAFFSFIGSARVGWMLRSKLAPGARCALEHGGAAPVIVAEDADLHRAIPSIAKGGLYHAGQVCVSVQRVFAHRSIARDLATRLAEAASAMTVGDPTKADTEVGPLIRPREVARVHEWVEEAVAAGAERLSGGEPVSETTYPCTVLYDPPPDARVSTLEVFGPVICVYAYDDMDAAIATANDVPWAFQAAVFTRDMDRALRATSQLNASAVMVNDHPAFRIDGMPFAGLKQSGLGIGGIPYTMHDMQIEKMMVIHSPEL